MSFLEQMLVLKQELNRAGYVVHAPKKEIIDYAKNTKAEQARLKNQAIDDHLEKIKESDAVLVANYPKKGIEGYIGGNSFLEMGFAYALGKKIFLLFPIPNQENQIEISGLNPVTLNGKIERLIIP